MKVLPSDIRKYEEAMEREREKENKIKFKNPDKLKDISPKDIPWHIKKKSDTKREMKLTKNEKLMIENIINNEYSDGLDAMPWVFAVQYSHNEFPMESYKGILGSLIKKELIVIMSWEDDPDDNVVYLTESGKEIALQLFGEKYSWL